MSIRSGARNPPVPIQDLTKDLLLLPVPRIKFDNHWVPQLGGIPLLAKLGQGGMSAVYYGIHPRLNKEVAVKVLAFGNTNSELIARFKREAELAANISSPHLVSCIDRNEDRGIHYLVLEFINDMSAGQYLREFSTSGLCGLLEYEALQICIAATTGLKAAHDENVLHRDIKPENILLPRSKCGTVHFSAAKLADLGLARPEGPGQTLTGINARIGTPGYMSPEQALAEKAGKPADVFGMGVTLYTLLAGRTPFTGTQVMRVLMATAHEPHVSIRDLRPEISIKTTELIDRCLAKEPTDRYQTADELLIALKSCQQFAPTQLVHGAPIRRPKDSASPPSSTNGIDSKNKTDAPIHTRVNGPKVLLVSFVVLLVFLVCYVARQDLQDQESISESLSDAPNDNKTAIPRRPRISGQKIESVMARLKAHLEKAAGGATTFATQIKAIEMESVHVPIGSGQTNKSLLRGPPDAFAEFSVQEQSSPHAIGMCPAFEGPAYLSLDLSGQYKAFNFVVSQNDGIEPAASAMQFRILGDDNKVLWQSGPVSTQRDTQSGSISVENIKVLRLELDCAGEPRACHGIWFEPFLQK